MQPNIIERVWRQDKMVNVDVLNGFTFTDEEEAHRFIISGKNVNTPVDISGTITANFKNANGVLVPLTGTIEDGKAVVVLSRECYAVEGPFSLMIFADTVCIYAAIANVINSSGEVIAYPTATIPSVQELIEEVRDVIASIPQDYSALSQNVTDLKSAFDELPFVELYNKSARSTGYIAQDGSTTTTATWNITDYMPITSDTVYYYSGIRTPGTAPYSAFYNISKTFISTFKQQIGTNVLGNIPAGAAYVRFSVLDSDIDTFNFIKKGFPTNGDFETVNYALGTLSTEVGDLEDLDTEDKTSVVRAINEVNSHVISGIETAVDNWLDDHPDATTTVQDGSVTESKLSASLALKTINGYITPEMFGAVGDGVADDASELQSAINYAISNNIALKLTDGKTYCISTGLSINGWIDIPKSTATIKALSALTPQMIYIQSPSIISDRNEIGKRYTISLNIDCNGSAIGIHGQQFFEYIIHDTYIKNAAIGIQVDSPAAEVSFVDCYIDGSDIAWSVGVANNASDVQYDHVRMYNCHTAFNVTAYCEIINCHPWMDNNINGSIGIKSSSVCRVTNSFVDTYQKSFYKTNGSNLIVDDCYINVSNEFYSSDYGNAIIFYGENNTDYSYSLLSNLFIVSGNGITTKLSNISGFSTPLINSRLESVDTSMMLSKTGLIVNTAPIESAGTGLTLNAQSLSENVYARYLELSISATTSIQAWSAVAVLKAAYRPKYTATFWGAKSADGTSIPFFVQADGNILVGKAIASGEAYRIAGLLLK